MVKTRLESNAIGGPESSPMFKLILCDYSMPDMDGFQCLKAIRNLCNSYQLTESTNKPFLCCLTAYPLNSFTKEMRQEAGDSVQMIATKPIFKGQLLEILTKSAIEFA